MGTTMQINKFFFSALLGLTAMTSQAEVYTIDPMHTAVRFSIDHMATSTNHGGFYEITGEVDFDANAKKGFVGITIPIASLDTNIKMFNEHLKSADFFNAKKYPTAYFKSTKWHFDGEKVSKIDGELTLLDKTHPVTLTAKKFNCYDNPILKAKSCGGDFETTIDRTKWGIDTYANIPNMRDVKLNIQIEAYKK